MSGPEEKQKRALAIRPADYDVGYAKPPVESRFKAGKSGNPRGRPKGAKNRTSLPALNEERLKSIILEEAYRTIVVNDANGAVSIPMVQAVVRSMAVNAAKGQQRAQRLFTQLLSATERENKRMHDEWLETAIEYKVEWERELERRKGLNIDAPAPIPHPDDIIIDMRTGSVRVKGPMTKEDKALWDKFRERKRECDRSIVEMEGMLEREPDYPHRQFVLDDIEHEKRIRAMITRVIPD